MRRYRARRSVDVVIDYGTGSLELWGTYTRVEHAHQAMRALHRLGFRPRLELSRLTMISARLRALEDAQP